MWRGVVAVCLIVAAAPARAGPKRPFTLTATMAPSFAGFVEETAVLELVLHNPSGYDVSFAWKRLDPFVALDVRDERGARVTCKPAARARRTRTPAWFVPTQRDLVIAIDLLERCRFAGEGEYVIKASFRDPAGPPRRRTNITTTRLVLGGDKSAGPATTPTVPALCKAEAAAQSGCFWSRGVLKTCSGVARHDEPEKRFPDAAEVPAWSCVCNGCVRDADCTARAHGACKPFRGDPCAPGAHACVYPGDACYPPAQCHGAECLADGRGGVSCRDRAPPPP